MRMTHYSAIGFSIVFASCTALDPDYAEYKKLKDAQAAGQSPYGEVDDFGVPGAGPEGAPYQPLPSVHNAPPAPAPIVTKNIATIELRNETETGAVNNPTAQVKITKDITLGFISNNKYFE